MKLRKLFVNIIIVSLSLSALISVILVLTGSWGSVHYKILGTTLAAFGYSLTALACAALYDKSRYQQLSIIGIGVSVIAFLNSVIRTWIGLSMFDSFKFSAALWVLSITMAHICLLLLVRPNNKLISNVLSVTLFMIALVAVMILLIIFEFVDFTFGDWYTRLMVALFILDVLGSIVVAILNRSAKK